MALAIRLARAGSKKRPFYRIVVADKRAPRDGRFIEKLGTHNPLLAKDDPTRTSIVAERIQYWLGEGAKPTERCERILASQGIGEITVRNNPNQGLPGKKALERIEEQKLKVEAKKEAEAEAKAAAKAAAEAPVVEEAPVEAAPEAAPEATEEAKEVAADAPAEAAEEVATDAPAEEAKEEKAGA
jgi:small subunit ribosomal protein S16